jgi:hypothetical protein
MRFSVHTAITVPGRCGSGLETVRRATVDSRVCYFECEVCNTASTRI